MSIITDIRERIEQKFKNNFDKLISLSGLDANQISEIFPMPEIKLAFRYAEDIEYKESGMVVEGYKTVRGQLEIDDKIAKGPCIKFYYYDPPSVSVKYSYIANDEEQYLTWN